jgi:2-phospho-L-lactate guanylyltransferase (CobY/MobA/RfbA family)
MFPNDPLILLVPGDLPLVKREHVDDFLGRCRLRSEADVYLAMVPRESFLPPYDQVHKYMSPFQDGTMCHGNLALISPGILHARRAMDHVEPLYQQRLSPLRAALAVGPGLGLLYLFGVHFFHRLRLESFARLASRHFGLKMLPIVVPYPEVAVDIDEVADYQVACQVLR